MNDREHLEVVKTCPGCGTRFSLQELCRSGEVQPLGMQFTDPDHQYNVYFFTHTTPRCGSTFVVPVLRFLPLIQEPVSDLALTGLEDCERHCLSLQDLEACSAPCRYAPFRRFLLSLRRNRTSTE